MIIITDVVLHTTKVHAEFGLLTTAILPQSYFIFTSN